MHTVTSPANTAIKAARKLLRRRARDVGDEFLVEGPAVKEALPWLTRLFVAPDALSESLRAGSPLVDDGEPKNALAGIADLARSAGVDVVSVDPAVLAELSDTVTSRGVVGVASVPKPSLSVVEERVRRSDTRRVLVADGVADPGNAGTLIRTADATGMDAVIFTIGSVDSRNPKTVRASAGSLFHLPVLDRVDPVDLFTLCAQTNLDLIGADAAAVLPVWDAPLARNCAIVVGSEAHGLSPVLGDAVDLMVSIPMTRAAGGGVGGTDFGGAAESLNVSVSAAILMYESLRQHHAANPEGRLGGVAAAGNRKAVDGIAPARDS